MKVSANLTGKKGVKSTAANGRFGVMAAVIPRTILCGNKRLYPAGNSVEAATTPSRWDVSRHLGDSANEGKMDLNKVK